MPSPPVEYLQRGGSDLHSTVFFLLPASLALAKKGYGKPALLDKKIIRPLLPNKSFFASLLPPASPILSLNNMWPKKKYASAW